MPYYETYATRSEAVTREFEIKRKKSANSIRAIIRHTYPQIDLL